MHIQLYFSSHAQKYFRIPAASLAKDTETSISEDWWSLWRCEHLISTEDGSQHLFLFSNDSSGLSLIIPDECCSLEKVLDHFQQLLLLKLCDFGMEFPSQPMEYQTQFLRGRPGQLIRHMREQSNLALHKLCELGLDICDTERELHCAPTSRHRLRPAHAVRQLIHSHSPLPVVAPPEENFASNIIAFPGA